MLCWFIKRTTGCWYLGIWVYVYICTHPPSVYSILRLLPTRRRRGGMPAKGLSSNGTSGSSSAVYPAPAVPTTKSIIICRQQRLYNQLNTFNKHLYYQQMTIPCQLANFHIHHHVGHLIGPPRFQSYGPQCWQGKNSRRNNGIFPIFSGE